MSIESDSFIAHLIELRDRLLRAVIAVVVVFVCLMPWAGNIYDLLAQPMMQALPEGT
ncbi:MAG: Sec-independent protein translocase subunit TatC, partial [Zoogloea sp.]|nr:Sec-independent protein translocase subunit TatC [Zoogloea sp.]